MMLDISSGHVPELLIVSSLVHKRAEAHVAELAAVGDRGLERAGAADAARVHDQGSASQGRCW